MTATGRPGLAGARIPFLWPGMIVTLVLGLLSMLAGAGVKLGSTTSVLSMGLTCLGMALAWGYLIAGATAGGWQAKLVVGLSLLLFLYPSWHAMVRGYSGVVLLLGLVLFLAWRWRHPHSEPLLDFLVTGVIFLLLYGVIAERTAMIGALKSGGHFFGLALALQTVFLSYLTGSLMMLVGSSIGEAGVRIAGSVAGWLVRLPAPMLLGLVGLFALGKIGWDISRYHGPAWITVMLTAAAAAAWGLLVRPRPDWPDRLPYVVLGVGLAFMLVSNSGGLLLKGTAQPVIIMAALYAAALTGLAMGGICLALGRRPAALLAGLAGIWILFAAGNGEVQVPLPLLSWLAKLPKMEAPASDGAVHLALLGWALGLWVKGRRDPAPYALILAGMVLFLGFNGLDYVYEKLPSSLIPLLVFAAASLYSLWQVIRGARRRQGREALAWTGLTVGAALLLFTAGYWAQLDDFGQIYAPTSMPYLGYAMFSLAMYWYGMLRRMARLTEERGDLA